MDKGNEKVVESDSEEELHEIFTRKHFKDASLLSESESEEAEAAADYDYFVDVIQPISIQDPNEVLTITWKESKDQTNEGLFEMHEDLNDFFRETTELQLDQAEFETVVVPDTESESSVEDESPPQSLQSPQQSPQSPQQSP